LILCGKGQPLKHGFNGHHAIYKQVGIISFFTITKKKKASGVGGSTFVIHDKLLVVEFVVIEGWFVNGYWNSLSIVYSGWKVVY
jgi:hypothetical protein